MLNVLNRGLEKKKHKNTNTLQVHTLSHTRTFLPSQQNSICFRFSTAHSYVLKPEHLKVVHIYCRKLRHRANMSLKHPYKSSVIYTFSFIDIKAIHNFFGQK